MYIDAQSYAATSICEKSTAELQNLEYQLPFIKTANASDTTGRDQTYKQFNLARIPVDTVAFCWTIVLNLSGMILIFLQPSQKNCPSITHEMIHLLTSRCAISKLGLQSFRLNPRHHRISKIICSYH